MGPASYPHRRLAHLDLRLSRHTHATGRERRLPAAAPPTQKGLLTAGQVSSLQGEGDGAAREGKSLVRIDRGDCSVRAATGLALRVTKTSLECPRARSWYLCRSSSRCGRASRCCLRDVLRVLLGRSPFPGCSCTPPCLAGPGTNTPRPPFDTDP